MELPDRCYVVPDDPAPLPAAGVIEHQQRCPDCLHPGRAHRRGNEAAGDRKACSGLIRDLTAVGIQPPAGATDPCPCTHLCR